MRLTKADKQHTINSLLEAIFDPQFRELDKREDKIATELYNVVYTKEIKRKMKALPPEFFTTTSRVEFKITEKQSVGGHGRTIVIDMLEGKRAGAMDNWNITYPDLKDNKHDDALVQSVREIQEERSELCKKKEAERIRISSVMDTFTTRANFAEAWPEAAEYLPEARQHTGNLPAKVFDDLNADLGLPVSKKAA